MTDRPYRTRKAVRARTSTLVEARCARKRRAGWSTRKAWLIGLLIAETEVSDQACDFLHVGQALVLQTNARERSVSTESKAGNARQSVAGGSAGARTERQGEYCQPRPAQPPCFAHRMLNPIALPQRLRKDAGKWSLRSPAACSTNVRAGLHWGSFLPLVPCRPRKGK